MIERWRRLPPWAVDVLLALVFAVVTVISVVVNDQQDTGVLDDGVGLVAPHGGTRAAGVAAAVAGDRRWSSA